MEYDTDNSEILIDRLVNSGQYERAIEILLELLAQDSENTYLHEQLGYCYYLIDEDKKSKNEFEIVLKNNPESNYALYMLASIHFYTSYTSRKALNYIQRAIEIDPDDASHWILLGRIHNHSNDHSQAQECAQRAQQIEPDNFAARQLKVEIMADVGNPADHPPMTLIKAYEDLLTYSPENAEVHAEIAELYSKRLHHFDTAIHHYETTLRIDPEQGTAKKGIVHAMGCKSWIYRLLYFPRLFKNETLRFFVSFVYYLTTWPVLAAYRYLTLVETRKRLGQLYLYKGFTAKIHRSPFWLRMSACVFLWLGFGYFWYHVFASSGSPRDLIIFIFVGFFTLMKWLGIIYILSRPISWTMSYFRNRKTKDILTK